MRERIHNKAKHLNQLSSCFLWTLVLLWTSTAYLSAAGGNRLAIITSTDTSELGLGPALQEALGKLAVNTRLFEGYHVDYVLTGFTTKDIAAGFDKIHSDLITFAYLEKARISIFLFDSGRLSEFIVSSKYLNDLPGEALTSAYIESRFKMAFQEVISRYVKKDFQPLPGTNFGQSDTTQAQTAANQLKSEEAKKLFRELAALEYRRFYVGASLGMSRFNSGGSLASTVDFGGYGGFHPVPRLALELGVDIFSYSLLHLEGRYQVPFAEKYVSLSLSAGVGRVMSHLTENQGFTTADQITPGTMGYGPGIGLEIPLLGANLRGDLRYYFSNSPILIGTYGILYSL